ncbi:hypothetical protein INT43_000352 [Umbelopsis isabellina]|uniref:Endonuclease III homolog n=1 Tax=Mortierella isabellina TaxID=91625 RepID=A0A8H7Q1Z3_MORIS|nr:hypothetical protein INT43_000352 [Umbelopsis isabellina]
MATKRQSARLSEKVSIKTPAAPLSLSSHLAKYKNDIPVKDPPVSEAVTTTTTAEVTTARKVKAAGARKVKKELSEPIEPPKNWKPVYEAIREYRKTSLAPVDTMGCERLGDVKADDKTFRFQTLVSLMLSSQTRDPITAAAMQNLQARLPGGLTLDSILLCNKDLLHDCIKAVGFHTRKTEYIKATAIVLKEKFDGDIPDTIEGLISLPGVGPKMGYLAMQIAWNKNAGIGVDVHVHRISNRLGWVNTATKTPEDTRKDLEAWLPKENWKEINYLLVGFGQTTCLPRGPKCNICPVNDVCPSAVIKAVKKKRKVSVSVDTADSGLHNNVKKEKTEESLECANLHTADQLNMDNPNPESQSTEAQTLEALQQTVQHVENSFSTVFESLSRNFQQNLNMIQGMTSTLEHVLKTGLKVGTKITKSKDPEAAINITLIIRNASQFPMKALAATIAFAPINSHCTGQIEYETQSSVRLLQDSSDPVSSIFSNESELLPGQRYVEVLEVRPTVLAQYNGTIDLGIRSPGTGQRLQVQHKFGVYLIDQLSKSIQLQSQSKFNENDAYIIREYKLSFFRQIMEFSPAQGIAHGTEIKLHAGDTIIECHLLELRVNDTLAKCAFTCTESNDILDTLLSELDLLNNYHDV